MDNKNVIGEVSVEVKAGLSVDDQTARICMDLLSIHFKNKGVKGCVLCFNDDGHASLRPLLTEDEVEGAMYSIAYCTKKRED